LLVELEVPELMLEELDVNFDPEATSDADPAEDPDKITDTVAPWSDVTAGDPALKEDDELRVEPLFRELVDPIVMTDAPLLVEVEDPELKLEVLDDPVLKEDDELRLEPPLKDDEETPELIEDTDAEVPVLALFDVPVMNEIEDPRLSVLVKPE